MVFISFKGLGENLGALLLCSNSKLNSDHKHSIQIAISGVDKEPQLKNYLQPRADRTLSEILVFGSETDDPENRSRLQPELGPDQPRLRSELWQSLDPPVGPG